MSTADFRICLPHLQVFAPLIPSRWLSLSSRRGFVYSDVIHPPHDIELTIIRLGLHRPSQLPESVAQLDDEHDTLCRMLNGFNQLLLRFLFSSIRHCNYTIPRINELKIGITNFCIDASSALLSRLGKHKTCSGD